MEPKSTSMRIDDSILSALRLARAEITAANRQPITSDSAAVGALIAYWDLNKRDTHAIQTGPVLVQASAEISAGHPLE